MSASTATQAAAPPSQSNGGRISSEAGTERPSGFTAANHSPSNSSCAQANEADSNEQSDGQKSDSESASGKRKHQDAQSTPVAPLKRQRMSVDISPTQAVPPTTFEQPNGQSNGLAHRPAEELPWTEHQRNGSTTSDAQLAAVLTNNMSGQSTGQGTSSPEQGFQPGQNIPADNYTQLSDGKYDVAAGTTAAQLQRGTGQRKRNFSNRTKTGCLTCRERKKKCDERKPSCANCERGGFFCKGYATNGSYKSNGPTQHPIQPSQANFVPYGQYAHPPHNAQLAYYDPQAQPMPQHPQDSHPRQPYPNGQWVAQPPLHYTQDSMQRQDYQPIAAAHPPIASQPPISTLPDGSRQHQQKMPPPPEPIHPPHNRSNSTHSGYMPYPPANHSSGQQYPYDTQRVTAQLALAHTPSREPATEKAKMLGGYPFNPADADLKTERYECATRVYRFNKNAIDPGNLSESSRRDQLRQILEPEASGDSNGRKSSSPRSGKTVGHLGNKVEIEAPFYCDYGYNIDIKDDVEIGANCRIMDACPVEIGARTIIGPDVKILTLDGHHDTARLPHGHKRLLRAARVKIGEDVFIGAGAIILPGRSIESGATIGAGTIVHNDVKGPYTYINNLGERKPKSLWQYGHAQAHQQQLLRQ